MVRTFLYRLRTNAIARGTAMFAGRLRCYVSEWTDGNRLPALLVVSTVAIAGAFAGSAYSDHQRIAAERQRRAELTCLAVNVYHEARGESMAGQRAVAEVTLNRVASPLYPDTVCAVVHEKRWDRKRERFVGAFSWTELDRVEMPQGVAWRRAAAAAQAVYDHEHAPQVGNAMHYHATRITPVWAEGRSPRVTIGRHAFYD